MEKIKVPKQELKYTVEKTMDAIPILDAGTNITEIQPALPVKHPDTDSKNLPDSSKEKFKGNNKKKLYQ